MFVFPVCWNTYKDLLQTVLIEESPIKFEAVLSKNMKRQRERYFELIRIRNEVFDEQKTDCIGRQSEREIKDLKMINVSNYLIGFFYFILHKIPIYILYILASR